MAPILEPPADLLRRLEFKALRQLDGFLFGDYRGLFYGPSLDLAEVREYQPGDEAARIDWNVTARTGKVHVRQYREERELTAWLVVDTSASMNFGTRRVLKRQLAAEFAGVAALAVTRHGDKIGALRFGEAGLTLLPPRPSRTQAFAVLRLLEEAAAGKRPVNLEAALGYLARVLRRRSLVFVLSDFLEPGPNWSRALGRLVQRHDVVAVRVSDPAERSLPKVGAVRLRDPETGSEVWLDTSDARVRAAHARLVGEREAALKDIWRTSRVDVIELDTRQGPLKPLLAFAARRRGRHS